MGSLVYFSSVSENTARFVDSCNLDELGITVHRIPLRPTDPPLDVREPYVLMTPTYGGGSIAKAVPIQVKRFLNDPANRAFIRGVIASGNTNFGEAYGVAGDVIAAKCHVPFLYRYELMGTPEDRERVRDGLVAFFTRTGDPTRHQTTASTTTTSTTPTTESE
ncbi:class Ib ribonucleoside-diphosphate reductase assembly flavoprotein NrdI [Bifidobacterium catulorum]|uniref:class Ib ribonucleoside-diphosphate reductase assembly flavoprotein NrdI n=1 Tax=Bifidobacterium catulorum TaxID=1630173 RepID=UPI001F4E26A1|nr:class Ib ribonucleoside-diphosphate reductase assembly flavoprotein NrdI [Bifidobacterium catulorum]